jgi:hypothetical protein
MSIRLRVSLSLAAASLASTAFAHHGWSWYGSEEFTLTGTVVETHFGNPHDRLTVESDGQRWNLVLSPPRRTANSGFGDDVIEVGDSVTAHGRRHKEAATLEMKTERIQVGDQMHTLYPSRT